MKFEITRKNLSKAICICFDDANRKRPNKSDHI